MKVYPRHDQEYKKKSSIDFELYRSNLYKTRPTGRKLLIYQWIISGVLGIFMAILAFFLDYFVEELTYYKFYAA